ncbi:MAG: hypothetical protein MZV70_55755 [Desulfobacterales bacterium]|nr:hypothetical protein [Desulfobacterales bacterium]
MLKDDPDAIALIRLGFRSAMPLFITRGLILRRIKSMAQEIFERHCGRVRYDLIQRIDETTRKFQKSLSEKTELTLSTIREALKRAIALKDRNETEVSATLSQLTHAAVRLAERDPESRLAVVSASQAEDTYKAQKRLGLVIRVR